MSDWAYIYEEFAFPDILDFYGDDTDNSYEKGPKAGAAGTFNADVVDSELSDAIGKKVVSIVFNYGHWIVVEDASSIADIHTTADLDNLGVGIPLILSFKPSGDEGGHIIFTSFHNHAQATEDMAWILKYLIFDL